MNISGRWVSALLYVIAIFIITPYLPRLIQLASSRWSSETTNRFVLNVEIIIALLLFALGIIPLIYKKKRTALFFILSIGGIFLTSFVLYYFLPNPYEFTHLPEYAILSILIKRAFNKNKGRCWDSAREIGKRTEKEETKKSGIMKNFYFLSGTITSVIGIGDEIYQHFLPGRVFTSYDIFLNTLGGILGLLIYWGMKK